MNNSIALVLLVPLNRKRARRKKMHLSSVDPLAQRRKFKQRRRRKAYSADLLAPSANMTTALRTSTTQVVLWRKMTRSKLLMRTEDRMCPLKSSGSSALSKTRSESTRSLRSRKKSSSLTAPSMLSQPSECLILATKVISLGRTWAKSFRSSRSMLKLRKYLRDLTKMETIDSATQSSSNSFSRLTLSTSIPEEAPLLATEVPIEHHYSQARLWLRMLRSIWETNG